jgi:hypothetical protein
MNDNEKLITQFYEALNQRDGEAMCACYDNSIFFSDPVFPELHGEEAKNMWRMLCQKSTDLQVSATHIQANDSEGSATWEAHYTFGNTGRKIHNQVQAQFKFKNHKMVHHVDQFSFWKWSRQALGPMGWIAGFSPWLLNQVRQNARNSLTRFGQKR